MRDLNALDDYRIYSSFHGSRGDHTCGAFVIPSPIDGQPLRVIASSDEGWDHVSVSRSSRCPNWPEMELIKRKFFKEDECAMQLHLPVKEHINLHPWTLHIWRPQQGTIPQPPGWMVGL
jgi:hypothetical protein